MTATDASGAGPGAGPLILRAELIHGGRTILAHTMEVGTTSAVVRTDEPFESGDRLLVRVSFPGLLEPFDLEAHVVSKRLPSGPGEPAAVTLVFVFSSEEEQERMRRLAEEGLPPAASEQALESYRVLLVEDSATIRDMLLFGARKHLRGRARLQLDVTDSAEAAWDKLQAASYQLAIVDHYLPGMHGAELVRRIRGERRLAGLPVVGISVGGTATRQAFVSAGADVFLDKPVVVRDLLTTLDRLVTRLGHVPRRRVLVVDDSPMFLEIARVALESDGYTVFCASTLGEVERLTSARPDLVLMDVQMPEAFGDDVAMVMRGVRDVNVPIYLLSSLDDSELERRAADADIDGYISKRRGAEHLRERVRSILGGAAG